MTSVNNKVCIDKTLVWYLIPEYLGINWSFFTEIHPSLTTLCGQHIPQCIESKQIRHPAPLWYGRLKLPLPHPESSTLLLCCKTFFFCNILFLYYFFQRSRSLGLVTRQNQSYHPLEYDGDNIFSFGGQP